MSDLEKVKSMLMSQDEFNSKAEDQLKQSPSEQNYSIESDAQRSKLSDYEWEVIQNKELRQLIDNQIQQVKNLPSSRERSLAITKLQEAVMWLGMDLKRLGEANPYPSSKDPSTGTKIEPTADGLKL